MASNEEILAAASKNALEILRLEKAIESWKKEEDIWSEVHEEDRKTIAAQANALMKARAIIRVFSFHQSHCASLQGFPSKIVCTCDYEISMKEFRAAIEPLTKPIGTGIT